MYPQTFGSGLRRFEQQLQVPLVVQTPRGAASELQPVTVTGFPLTPCFEPLVLSLLRHTNFAVDRSKVKLRTSGLYYLAAKSSEDPIWLIEDFQVLEAG